MTEAAQTVQETLEIKVGALASTVPLFKEGTVQTSAEIQRDRIKYKSLRNKWIYTANFGLYDLEKEEFPGVHDDNGEAVLYFGGREHNPIFSNLAEACSQLIKTGNYIPSAEASAQAKSSALRVRMKDLNLQRYDDEWSYYEISTSNYNALNKSQRALAEAVHGNGQQFVKVMDMLKEAGIGTTRIYVLNSNYVKRNANKNAVCRASWLVDFYVNSNFVAGDRNVSDHNGVRGVLSDSTEGGTQKSPEETGPYATAYKTLLSDQNAAVKAMTPQIADGISLILAAYRNQNRTY